MTSGRFTQVVLETVAGVVGVWEASMDRGCPGGLDLLLHLQSVKEERASKMEKADLLSYSNLSG